MDFNAILYELRDMSSSLKKESEDYESWLKAKDFLKFLKHSKDGEIPLYAQFKYDYLYSVAVPTIYFKEEFVDDLLSWDCGPSNSWGYSHSFDKNMKPKNISVTAQLDSVGSKILEKGHPLTFLRSFEGRIGRKGYVELSQFLIHLHGLHFDDAKNAYCRLDKNGDVEETIKIYHEDDGILVTIKDDVLYFHLFLNESVLVRLYDATRFENTMDIHRFNREDFNMKDEDNEIFFRGGLTYDDEKNPVSGWIRGFQIIRNTQPVSKMLALVTGDPLEEKKYEKFIAYDWRNKKIGLFSCDPKELDNYFSDTGKPLEISPAFFRPEVLAKYKQDNEKYTLSQRSIHCRGAWFLQTYDINEEGQVHTYLKYLACLPYSEQLHWKQYNEKPKGGISKRAFLTDLKGEFDSTYNPLTKLKRGLKDLQEVKKNLWSCEDENLYNQLNYTVTDSLKEWADEIHTLDKLVIEGFKKKYLKKMAKSIGCFDLKLGSINLLKKILEKKKIDPEEINNIIRPLTDIHLLRTKFSGHISGQESQKIRRQIISEHGSLKIHFRDLLERTEKAINGIIGFIKSGYL
jgi:hypothetical protein